MNLLVRVFLWVLENSLVATLLLGPILVLKATLGRRWPARWHWALWLLFMARLALPGPLLPSLPLPRPSVQAAAPPPSPGVAAVPAAPLRLEAPDYARSGLPAPVARHRVGLLQVWAAGAVLVLLVLAAETLRFGRAVRHGRVVTREPVLQALEAERAHLAVTPLLPIVETDRVAAPALFGLARPRLLVPTGLLDRISPEDLRHVLRHELAHLRRQDLAVGWAAAILQALHWFNPFIWYAFHRMRQDREMACDEAAIWALDGEATAGYGRTLLALAGALRVPRTVPALAGISETPSLLSRRIHMLSRLIPSARPSRWPIPSVAVLAAVAALGLSGRAPLPQALARVVPPVETTPAFTPDPAAVGTWRAVDFVREPGAFKAGERQWEGKLFMNRLTFRPDGTTSGPWSWTRGQLYHPGDRSLAPYEIRQVGGRPHLFMAWMSGDVILRGEAPRYCVFERDDSYREVQTRTEDQIDHPFVDDPALLGAWKPYDFVEEPGAFVPGRRIWQGELMDFQMEFLPGGRTPKPWLTWTRGLIIHRNDRTASHYEIREAGGRTYLLFEWKSGDYVLRGQKPRWYVMVRS